MIAILLMVVANYKTIYTIIMLTNKVKVIALSELRRIAERSRIVPVRLSDGRCTQMLERVPWRLWYVAASNGDIIRGEECVTIAVYPDKGSRLVHFVKSGQTRRVRDCLVLRANDFQLRI